MADKFIILATEPMQCSPYGISKFDCDPTTNLCIKDPSTTGPMDQSVPFEVDGDSFVSRGGEVLIETFMRFHTGDAKYEEISGMAIDFGLQECVSQGVAKHETLFEQLRRSTLRFNKDAMISLAITPDEGVNPEDHNSRAKFEQLLIDKLVARGGNRIFPGIDPARFAVATTLKELKDLSGKRVDESVSQMRDRVASSLGIRIKGPGRREIAQAKKLVDDGKYNEAILLYQSVANDIDASEETALIARVKIAQLYRLIDNTDILGIAFDMFNQIELETRIHKTRNDEKIHAESEKAYGELALEVGERILVSVAKKDPDAARRFAKTIKSQSDYVTHNYKRVRDLIKTGDKKGAIFYAPHSAKAAKYAQQRSDKFYKKGELVDAAYYFVKYVEFKARLTQRLIDEMLST
jgi:hypothetical protein